MIFNAKNFLFFFLIILLLNPVKAFNNKNNKFTELVNNLLLEKLDLKDSNIELNFEDTSKAEKVMLLTEYVNDVKLLNISNNAFQVKVFMNKGETLVLNGNFYSYVNIQVAKNHINSGNIITEQDINLTKIETNKLRKDYFKSTQTIVGMQAKRNLTPGTIFHASDLLNPPIIKKNDTVNIILITPNLELETTGKALMQGGIGDIIKIQNDTSGIHIYGKIIDRNTVKIEDK